MGALDDLQQIFQAEYAGQLSSWESWWNSNTKHGCFCGAGSQCDAPIDGLDSCCAQHDTDYGAVGVSADTMWSIEGIIATRHADRALASCAGSADVAAAGTDHANPDPESYRGHLITLFNFRADVGDNLAALYDRYEQLHRAISDFGAYLLSSNDQIIQGDQAAIDGAQQHVAYLQSLEATTEQIESGLQSAGVDTAAVREQVSLG
jgi:hypothetical protein